MAVILDYLTQVFSFIAEELQEIIEHPEDFFYLHELQEIEEQYLNGLDKFGIIQQFCWHNPDYPTELVYLVVTKLTDQLDKQWQEIINQ
jgi:hypothetical protein